MTYVVLGRIGAIVQQLTRHQNKARCAITALKSTAFDERFLHGIEPAVGCMFDGANISAVRKHREIKATRYRSAVDKYSAATTQPLRTTFARAGQPALLQHFDEVLVRTNLRTNRFAVEFELYGSSLIHSGL